MADSDIHDEAAVAAPKNDQRAEIKVSQHIFELTVLIIYIV